MEVDILAVLALVGSLISIGAVFIKVGQITGKVDHNESALSKWITDHSNGCPALSHLISRVDKMEKINDEQAAELTTIERTLGRLEAKMDMIINLSHSPGMKGSGDV